MRITGTHFHYYNICKRKLWLFANSITMEHNSELVSEGKLIHENSYLQRSDRFKELAIDGIKIDFFDAKNKVIHEIKKSHKKTNAHIWQLKYYIYVLGNHGIEEVKGLLEYPRLKIKEEILLTSADIDTINKMKEDIEKITIGEVCPQRLVKSKCKKCSYYDFCYSSEGEI